MGRIKDTSSKKLWIVSELFYPDETSTAYILTKIANRLTSKYEVNVICGPSIYDKEKVIDNLSIRLSDDIHIIRKQSSVNKNNLSSRFFHSITLSIKLFFSLYKNAKKNDTVFIVTNPPLLMVLISIIKKKRKFRLILLVHDVFPENTVPANIIKSSKRFFYRISKKIFDKSYSRANNLIVLGSDMEEIILKKIKKYKNKPEVNIIQNWAETELIYPVENHNNNKINFLFAGNLGRVQGLSELMSIISKVKNPILKFSFAGTGAVKEDIMAFAIKHNLSNVNFQGAYSRSEQVSILNEGNVGLVTLDNEMYGLGVPSKAYNIMAAGKPILFIGNKNSEIAQMIYQYEIGFVFSFEEEISIINFFNNLTLDEIKKIDEMGKTARYVAENYFSEKIILDKFTEII